jgi:Ser/Thr protein kinase RdoA (MazF antagonist)
VIDRGDADAIAAAFAAGDVIALDGPVARGEVGQVWKLSTASGAYAVKETFALPDADQVDEAVDHAIFQELAIRAGVPAPGIVRAVDGGVLAEINGTPVRLYEWVDVLAPDRTLDPVLVGSTVAAIHRVGYHGRNDVDEWYTQPVGAAAWDDLIEQLSAAKAPFAERLAARRAEIVALEALIAPVGAVQTCHRDLFADNVLPTPAGGLCVIDWENAGLADPSHELAVVLFEFACDQPGRVRALYESYRDSGGPALIDGVDAFTMAVAQIHHIGEIGCRRWLDPAHLDERPRNQARVDEFLADGLTLETVNWLLDSL